MCTLPGVNTALTQATANGRRGQLRALTRLRLRWGLWGSLGALLISGYYLSQGNSSLSLSLAIVALFIPFYNTFSGYYAYLQGRELFNQASLVQAVSRIIFLVGMLVAAWFFPTAPFLIGVYMIVTLLMQYAGYRWTLRHHEGARAEAPETTETASYGTYLSFWLIPQLVAAQIGTITVWYFLGDVQAAVFAVAVMIPLEMNRFGSLINQVAMPKMSQPHFDIPALFRKILKFELLMLSVWLLYALFAPFIFNLLFPTYPEAVSYSVVAMLSVLLVPKLILHALINAQKMKKIISLSYSVVPTLHILLSIPLVFLFGIWGAIFALLLSEFLEYLLLWVLIYLHLKRSHARLDPESRR